METLYSEIAPQVRDGGFPFDEAGNRIFGPNKNLILMFETTGLGVYGSVYSELKNLNALHENLKNNGLDSLVPRIQGKVEAYNASYLGDLIKYLDGLDASDSKGEEELVDVDNVAVGVATAPVPLAAQETEGGFVGALARSRSSSVDSVRSR